MAKINYTSLVTLGMEAVERVNQGIWALGAYTREAQALGYTQEEYGKAIGYSGKLLSEYACVTDYYMVEYLTNPDLHERIWELKQTHLCYTLYRDAKKLGDIAQSVEFLEMALSEGWSVDKARGVLADYLSGKPIFETWTVCDLQASDDVDTAKLLTDVQTQIEALRRQGYSVRVRVYGVGERVTA